MARMYVIPKQPERLSYQTGQNVSDVSKWLECLSYQNNTTVYHTKAVIFPKYHSKTKYKYLKKQCEYYF